MIRRALALLILPLIVGCSKPDPESSMLAPGDVMLLHNARFPGGINVRGDHKYLNVAQGIRFRVARDPGRETDPSREIEGVVLEGEHRDEGVSVERCYLRPAKD